MSSQKQLIVCALCSKLVDESDAVICRRYMDVYHRSCHNELHKNEMEVRIE